MSEPTPVLRTRGLRKRYGDRDVVRGVDLHVPRGVAFGFLGPNGAGKTTVIRMLLGLVAADGGEMELLGRTLPADRRAALARVGGYSLGMRQRLGIARCLLSDPELLILDEPANGLDPSGIRELRALIRSLVDEGRTVFLSSHLLDEVERTCDMAAVISDGRIVAQGTLDELAATREPQVELRLRHATEAAALLAGRPDVVRATAPGDDRVTVRLRAVGPRSAHEVTGELVRHLVGHGFAPYAVGTNGGRLEDRVLELLGRREPADAPSPDRALVEA